MRKHDPPFKPPSLAQHFEAPDDFVGCFGWLCGYSADSGFLNDAIERFTRRTKPQRAKGGSIAMALMLNPHNEQISLVDVPGVLHVPLKSVPAPFLLLHAKVALLGFRHESDPKRWRLRLIVSTGNWTRQTLEESLDLAWGIEVSNEDLKEGGDSGRQTCADIKAAWNMLDWLRKHFDARVLEAKPPDRSDSETTIDHKRFESWLAKAIRAGGEVVPRFFDNRSASLLKQFPTLVRQQGNKSARNYLAMGSGFYETSSDANQVPSVLKSIVDVLQKSESEKSALLTREPRIDVFVNPKACQAVATSAQSIQGAGWKVREPGIPDFLKHGSRTLHAKFIFSANRRAKSELCNGACLYLGSGNLTGPGFNSKVSEHSGNLEAGVVFFPKSLHWNSGKGIPPSHVLANVLPIQQDEENELDASSLNDGGDMPDAMPQFIAPPVAYFDWVVNDGGWLRSTERATGEFQLLDADGQPCRRDNEKGFHWPGTPPLQPRQVQIRWAVNEEQRQAWVPVLDSFGRIAATILPRIDIDEAWGQLANFPMPPEDEELLPDGDDEAIVGAVQQSTGTSSSASYPVRRIMELIENIAAKQTSVPKADWSVWCNRFEQCLVQAAGSEVLVEFLKLELNPLSPLWSLPFRPDFATDATTREGLRYEEALKRVETAWNVAHLANIGGNV